MKIERFAGISYPMHITEIPILTIHSYYMYVCYINSYMNIVKILIKLMTSNLA